MAAVVFITMANVTYNLYVAQACIYEMNRVNSHKLLATMVDSWQRHKH